MKDKAENAPRDLASLQYASWICENTIGMPANKSNLPVIADAIDAIAKSKFHDEKWKHPRFTAFVWLIRKCEHAKLAKIPTNHLFFLNGDYLLVPDPERKIPEFVPCRNCLSGWRYQMKEGKSTGRVEPCECRTNWTREARAK
jgi:hypothetical protein